MKRAFERFFVSAKPLRKNEMKIFKAILAPTTFALLMAAVLAGCGGGGSTSTDSLVGRSSIAAAPQAKVELGKAGSFAILTKTGITNVYASMIDGDIGASPITGAAIHLTCAEMHTGNVYTVDAAGPLPCATPDASGLTTAVSDMETAYTDAAGRTLPDYVELGSGEIGGLTLTPGLYKWGTDVNISNDVTLHGSSTDVWIFQIAGGVNQASATRVTLTGGALPQNVFWQSAGDVSIGTTAHFEGVLLAKTLVAVKTGASVNGRLLAQTEVTLQKNVVTQPAEVAVVSNGLSSK